MRSFERHIAEFRQRNVEVVAISVDKPEVSLKLCRSKGFDFEFLADPKAEVIRRYGVLHPGAGEDKQDIARPAEFLIDSSGRIQWEKLTDDIKVRARPEAVLAAIDTVLKK